MRLYLRLIARLFRETLIPTWPTGPRNPRRLAMLLVLIPTFLALQGVHWVGLLLDDLLFRGYREVEIKEPLFVVGLPRSGTSSLQRVLAGDTNRFTTLRLWELLLAPSVTERKLYTALGSLDRRLGRPLARLGAWGDRKGFRWLDVIHQVSLKDPEEDYFLLLPAFACFLLVVPFPFHDTVWRLSRFDDLPSEERRPIMDFYQGVLRRHLYVVGEEKQILSKNPSFTPFLQTLQETFPDGRFICCLRDPLQVVPSLLSSIQTGADLFGYRASDPRVRDRFVDMLEYFASHALTTLGGADPSRYAYAPLSQVKGNVKGFVLEVYERFGWTPDPDFRRQLDDDTHKSRRYRSRHAYSLSDFGLEEDELRLRFQILNRRFGFHGQGGSEGDDP